MLALIALLLAAPALSAPADEMRGLWVVRTALLSPQAVDRTLDQAQRAGINTLFVQVRGRGDAFYRSALAPRSLLLWAADPTFDPFARLLDGAHQRGLKVHAWINVLLAAHFSQKLTPDHVVARHPEWVMIPRPLARIARDVSAQRAIELMRQHAPGDTEGFYLSPSAPGVAEHLQAIVTELLRSYQVDGLHLDFVRYPGDEYDYSQAALQSFARAQGQPQALLDAPAQAPLAWSEFRRAAVTGLVTRLAEAARREQPGLPVSAAVIADQLQAQKYRFQDWPAWLKGGVLDAACPMAYTNDPRLFQAQVERAAALRKPPATPAGRAESAVWAGVGAYRLSVDAIIRNIRTARAAGASGVILFSHESLASRDLDRLRTRGFGVPAAAGGNAQGSAAAAPRAR